MPTLNYTSATPSGPTLTKKSCVKQYIPSNKEKEEELSEAVDKIKELDEVGKIEVEPTDRVEYQLNNKVQATYEQLENKEFSGRDFYFEKTSTVFCVYHFATFP